MRTQLYVRLDNMQLHCGKCSLFVTDVPAVLISCTEETNDLSCEGSVIHIWTFWTSETRGQETNSFVYLLLLLLLLCSSDFTRHSWKQEMMSWLHLVIERQTASEQNKAENVHTTDRSDSATVH